MPSFCSIVIQISKFHFWLVNNCSNIEGEIFSLHICQKCVICCQKNWCWCREKTLKITVLPEAPNMVKMESEIYKYFSQFHKIATTLSMPLKTIHVTQVAQTNQQWRRRSKNDAVLLLKGGYCKNYSFIGPVGHNTGCFFSLVPPKKFQGQKT